MHILEPIYILRALNMGTCIQQGDLFYSAGLHSTANTGKTWERFWKNASEWTRRVEISKEEINDSKHSCYAMAKH